MEQNKEVLANVVQTIETLFDNHLFSVPNYQRGYSWDAGNISTLLKDLMNNNSYYLGNVLLNKNEDGTYEIIDGQQRITTLYLILLAIYHLDESKVLKRSLIKKDEQPIIKIESRTDDASSQFFVYLINKSELPDSLTKTNESVGFEIIKKQIASNNYDLSTLYQQVTTSKVLVIDSTELPVSPYQLFLNLNTKGKKLDSIDILKCHAFNIVCTDKNFKALKNNWYELFNKTDEKFSEDYLVTYANLQKPDNKKRRTVKESLEYLESSLKTVPETKRFFKDFGSTSGLFYITYKAVYSKEAESAYVRRFNESQTNVQQLFNYLRFIKKIGFKQANILFLALLDYYAVSSTAQNKRKKHIRDNFGKIANFIQLIFMYSSMQQLKKLSPSGYGNKFVQYANELMKDNGNIPGKLSEVLTDLKINKIDESDIVFFGDKDFTQDNKQNMAIAVALISYLDNDTSVQYSGEHCIPDSTNNDEAKLFGNIIPVADDCFCNKDVSTKIKEYRKKIHSEKHIKIFLENDIDDQGNFNSKKRTDRYKRLFIQKFNSLCEDLIIPKEGE